MKKPDLLALGYEKFEPSEVYRISDDIEFYKLGLSIIVYSNKQNRVLYASNVDEKQPTPEANSYKTSYPTSFPDDR